MTSQAKGGYYTVTLLASEYDALKELIDRASYMLGDSYSGFIPGCGSDEAWCKSRDVLVAKLKAAKASP